MSTRLPAPPAPAPLEAYAAQFDACFSVLAQRCCFRDYLQGLLLPRDRNKTLTALGGAEPITQAQAPPVQRLQFFLSESTWSIEAIQQQRLQILLSDPATRPHEAGVLIIDETGDRKAGTKTAHVARQYLGSVGKVDNGIVAVTSLWADERLYYPLHVQPYEPAPRLPKGKKDPAFRTKPQIGMALVDAALALGVSFRAVVADCGYGESEAFDGALWEAGVPYVVGLKPNKGRWAPQEEPHTPQEAAQELCWKGADDPQDWTPVERRYRDGHTEIWWAAELTLGGYGPDKSARLVVATTDPATLPEKSTWYLATNLPKPGTARCQEWSIAPAELAEVVRLYGLRNWVEQSYKQSKQELGWADFQVRQDRAIRRHWELVCCAFCFCWWERFHSCLAAQERDEEEKREAPGTHAASQAEGRAREGRKRGGTPAGEGERGEKAGERNVAGSAAAGTRLVSPVVLARALVASMERSAPAARTTGAADFCGNGSAAHLGSPVLTNYR
jgi:SRSO17 transposase